MKKYIYYIASAILIANILIGVILSSYSFANVCISSFVIIVTTLLLIVVQTCALKDAFKISLSFIYLLIGVLEFILSLFSPQQFNDNWFIIAFIILSILEGTILLISKYITNLFK